jgi:hypothetical protein
VVVEAEGVVVEAGRRGRRGGTAWSSRRRAWTLRWVGVGVEAVGVGVEPMGVDVEVGQRGR